MAERLHERTVQDLAAARLILEGVRDLPADSEVGVALDQANDLLADDIQDLRSLLSTGEATEWQTDDLAGALAGWVEALPKPELIRLALPAESLSLTDPDVAVVFRVVKESVRNAVKHAQATRIDVQVTRDEQGGLIADVHDDGVGCELTADPRSTGLGLRLMRHATAAAGGSLRIESSPGAGTVVQLRLPAQVPGTTHTTPQKWGSSSA